MVSPAKESIDTDVFVVGAGPAGLVAAIAARRKGLRVIAADSAHPPLDKACGEGLMPDALLALERLGIFLPQDAGMTFTGIRFIGNGSRAEAAFPRGMGMGVRRTKLHEILVREAAAAGVRMMWGTTVSQTPDRVMVAGGAVVRSRWVVGADGQKSRVREWAGIRSRSREKARYGFRGHFSIRPWTDLVEVYWGSACQVIITPVNPGEICVALMTQDAGRGFAAALSQFPALQMRLKGAAPSSALRGALSIQRTLRAVVKDRYVLVGDASGSVDAITGEGLSLSFQEAECLAEALACDDLSLYQKGHRRIRRVASMMAQMMLLMDASPPLGKAVLRFFASCPRVFQVFLATHLGMSASEIES